MTLTIELAADIEEQLHVQAAASGVNAETFVMDSVTDRLKRLRDGTNASREQRLSAEESRLMQEINRGPDDAPWQRYRSLVRKRQDETISSEELSELIRLSDLIEGDHVRRLRAVSELAGLRGTTLESLMKEMELWRSTDV